MTYGAHIGVRANNAGAFARSSVCWPPGWRTSPTATVDCLFSLIVGTRPNEPRAPERLRRYNLLYVDAQRLARDLDLEPVLGVLRASLHLQVAQHARRHVFVHAGVVGWRGQAIVILGQPGTGRTELVRALIAANAEYCSDMFAVFDSAGRVHPYPTPLAPSPNGSRGQSAQEVTEATPRAAQASLPVGMIVATEYKPGTRCRLRVVSAGQGVLALMAYALPARARPALVLRTLERVTAGAVALRGARGETCEITETMLNMMDT